MTKLATKEFWEAVGLVSRMTGTDQLGLRAARGRLAVSGEANGHAATVWVDFPGKDAFEISLQRKVLDQTLKNRKDVDIQVQDSVLQLRASSLKADLATQPFAGAPELDRSTAIEIDTEQQAILDTAIPTVLLSPVYENDTLFLAEFGKRVTHVACMDQMHFALYTTAATKRRLNLVFPSRTFATITDAARKREYQLAATASNICAWGSDFELLLPFVQQEVGEGIADVVALAKSFGSGVAIISVAEMRRALESAMSTCEDGGSIQITCGKKRVQIHSQSTAGSVTETLEATVSASAQFNIVPNTVLDLLGSVHTEECEFGVFDDKFFFLRTRDDVSESCYGCLLAQTE